MRDFFAFCLLGYRGRLGRWAGRRIETWFQPVTA